MTADLLIADSPSRRKSHIYAIFRQTVRKPMRNIKLTVWLVYSVSSRITGIRAWHTDFCVSANLVQNTASIMQLWLNAITESFTLSF